MKWSLLAAILYLCAVALPRPALLETIVSVQHTFDTISVSLRRMASQADEQAEGTRGPDRFVETSPGHWQKVLVATAGVEDGSRRTVALDEYLSGPARVIDGDTIAIGAARVRLHGVDAPESEQSCLADGKRWPCGQRAARALAGEIGGRTVACSERDRDRYGRLVAVCRHDGQDVNAWLVAQGWALAYRRYSRAYVHEESSARAARRGIWRGEFVAPWDWRRAERLARPRREAPRMTEGVQSNCRIKGNISYNRGKRIYHMPGDRDYARTKISPTRGERWFCSEAEARAAGWRRAGR